MAKETRLDDSAGIYAKRTKETEKQKLSNMTFREKMTYFHDYYLKICIFTVIALGVVGCLIYTFFAPKPKELLSVAVINEQYDQEKLSTFLKNVDQHFEVKKDKEKIIYDYSYFISGDGQGDSANSIQKLYTHVAAEQIDIIITDASTFKNYMELGYFIKLSNALPEDLYNELTEYYITGKLTKENSNDNIADTTQEPYGIRLDSCDVYRSTGSLLKEPVLGIVLNSPNKDNDVKFIRYLFEK